MRVCICHPVQANLTTCKQVCMRTCVRVCVGGCMRACVRVCMSIAPRSPPINTPPSSRHPPAVISTLTADRLHSGSVCHHQGRAVATSHERRRRQQPQRRRRPAAASWRETLTLRRRAPRGRSFRLVGCRRVVVVGAKSRVTVRKAKRHRLAGRTRLLYELSSRRRWFDGLSPHRTLDRSATDLDCRWLEDHALCGTISRPVSAENTRHR